MVHVVNIGIKGRWKGCISCKWKWTELISPPTCPHLPSVQ